MIRAVAGSSSESSDRQRSSADERAPRRLMIWVAGAVVAVLALGSMWIGAADTATESAATGTTPSTDVVDSAQTAPESSSAPSTSTTARPVFTTAVPLPTLEPGYVLDPPPPGFHEFGANESDIAAMDFGPPLGSFELWAEPNATRTSGRWFAAATSQCQFFGDSIVTGATRLAVGDRAGYITTATDGVQRVVVGASNLQNNGLTLMAFGFTPDEMSRLAESIVLDAEDPTVAQPDATTQPPASSWYWVCDDTSPDPQIRYRPSFAALSQGLERLVVAPSLWGEVSAQLSPTQSRGIYYLDPNANGYTNLSLTAQPANEGGDVLARFLVETSPDPAAPQAPERTLQVGNRVVTVGAEIWADSWNSPMVVNNIVRWNEGDQTLVLSGTVSLTTLLDALATVREASTEEWQELIAAGSDPPPPLTPTADPTPDPTTDPTTTPEAEPRYHVLGSSRTNAGVTWDLSMSVDPDWVRLSVDNSPNFEAPISIDPMRPVTEYIATNTTVLVITTRSPGAATDVRVTVDGIVVAMSTLEQVVDTGVYAGIAVFEELPPYTVELLDESGAVTAQLAP